MHFLQDKTILQANLVFTLISKNMANFISIVYLSSDNKNLSTYLNVQFAMSLSDILKYYLTQLQLLLFARIKKTHNLISQINTLWRSLKSSKKKFFFLAALY